MFHLKNVSPIIDISNLEENPDLILVESLLQLYQDNQSLIRSFLTRRSQRVRIKDKVTIGRVKSTRILGLTVKDNMKWNEHVYDIVKKASKRLYMYGY